MKRKLDEKDVPVPAEATSATASSPIPPFTNFNLDPRLLQTIQSQQYTLPTPIQASVIPLALQGKSILARSQTGSGKTAAYVLPILQQILLQQSLNSVALILVPTRELAGQVTKVASNLASGTSIKVVDLTKKEDDRVQRARLAGNPNILVSTPSRITLHINAGALSLSTLSTIVIDEADIILTYGHEDDLKTIAKVAPKGIQILLMSATLKNDLHQIKSFFSCNPEVITMDQVEKVQNENLLKQYIIKSGEEEKFLLLYAIFILKLIKGKIIIFVSDVDRCYRLKLFFEQFAIKSCVLNAELPVNSRIHVVEEFNKNVYDIIIASDENEVIEADNQNPETSIKSDDNFIDSERTKQSEHPDEQQQEQQQQPPSKKSKKQRSKKDASYGISRGIDFRAVSCVLNFDFPTSSTSYVHRIGRTARAGRAGMALSFVVPKDQHHKHKPTSIASTANDETVLQNVITEQEEKGRKIEDYVFDLAKLEGFRYRLGDAMRAVTGMSIREARIRELRNELLKSEKLKRHFDENPDELRNLRHDGELRSARVQLHLKHVPDYLLPGGTKKAAQEEVGGGFIAMRKKDSEKRFRKGKGLKRGRINPLQSFKGRKKGKM